MFSINFSISKCRSYFYLIGYLKNPSRILGFVKLMHLIQLQSDAQIFLGPCANMSFNKTTETEHVGLPHRSILELYICILLETIFLKKIEQFHCRPITFVTRIIVKNDRVVGPYSVCLLHCWVLTEGH